MSPTVQQNRENMDASFDLAQIPPHSIRSQNQVVCQQPQQTVHGHHNLGQSTHCADSKPMATVSPTTHYAKIPHLSSTRNAQVQTNDVDIDIDLLFHMEDMLRTQRSLTLPKYDQLTKSKSLATLRDTFCSPPLDSHYSCSTEDEVWKWKRAFLIQSKVNTDLKHLLVSSLAGKTDLVERMSDLMTDNLSLTDHSEGLQAQTAVLAEVADTAGIAANVWRAKCLAGRVVAKEAARRSTAASRKMQLAYNALAHLVGERTRIRLELGQVAAQLCSSTPASIDSAKPIARDTLGLAQLCHTLASNLQPKTSNCLQPVFCHSDTPGEKLALTILTHCDPMEDLSQSSNSSADPLTSLLPPTEPADSRDFIEQAVKSFSSTRFTAESVIPSSPDCTCPAPDNSCHLSFCRGCKGPVRFV